MEFDIARQQITKKIDVIFGGGTNMYLPKSLRKIFFLTNFFLSIKR